MCRRKECLEAQKNATPVEGRGPSLNQQKQQQQPPAIDPNVDRWINASGGVTISKKYKKGIIQ